jgi:hypothetical protein
MIVVESDRTLDTNTGYFAMASQLSNTRKHTKHTIKYLACCTDPQAYTAVVRAAPSGVIRGICNAAINVQQGDIDLSPKQKTLFSAHQDDIATLTSPDIRLARKRKIIESQTGGFFFIPALIGAALGAIGSHVIGSLVGGQQPQQ